MSEELDKAKSTRAIRRKWRWCPTCEEDTRLWKNGVGKCLWCDTKLENTRPAA